VSYALRFVRPAVSVGGLPRQARFDAADLVAAGSPPRQRSGRSGSPARRTLLLAVWALLLAAVFAVALRSSAEDGSSAAATAVRAATGNAAAAR